MPKLRNCFVKNLFLIFSHINAVIVPQKRAYVATFFLIAYNSFMVYFIAAALFIAYLEIFGRAVLSILHKDHLLFSFGIGWITWLSTAYVLTSLLTAANCSFRLILIICSCLFAGSLFLIFRERKEIMWKPPLLHWVLLLVSVVCLTPLIYI